MPLAMALLSSGCALLPESGGEGPPNIEVSHLIGHWMHSYEEESIDSPFAIYRRADGREFPPSRFRMQYVFAEDGALQWYYLAPNDGHHFRSGSWHLNVGEHVLLTVEQGDETRTYRIVGLDEETLRITAMEAE